MTLATVRKLRDIASWQWITEDEIHYRASALQMVFSEIREALPQVETRTNIRRLEAWARTEGENHQ